MKKLFARLILISEPFITFSDRLDYIWTVISRIAPIAFILNLMGWWWADNQQFGSFMCMVLITNAVVGIYFHLKFKTFNWKDFIVKNLEMTFIVIAGYLSMETLRYTAGDNIAGELFKALIQVCTLLYPASKIWKNIYILSNGKYPPKFFMERLYDFEKNGDLNDFFNKRN